MALAMRRFWELLIHLAVATSTFATSTPHQHKTSTVLAPGYRPLEFEAPAFGSYRLPVLGMASDGVVLASDGTVTRLHDLLADRVVVLSFIFTSCLDVNGCPLATYVLSRTQARVQADAQLRDHVRFISLSFDPERDTPERMRNYSKAFLKTGSDWRFLTTSSESVLAPLLSGYNQSIQKDIDADGKFLGSFSHLLRVFLIDQQGNIRNIYNTSFLHADIVFNDIKTIQGPAEPAKTTDNSPAPVIHGPGDDKRGYERSDYRTSSKNLTDRRGREANLLALSRNGQLGLPPLPIPAANPMTEDKIRLGRRLFFDRRLSHNDTISCAMCHIPEQGFSNNELATAIGIEGRTVRRNAPSLYNVGYVKRLFHDARELELELQILSPLLAANEMGNPAIGHLLQKLKHLPNYQIEFERAFPDRGITVETLGMAIASYERALVSANSPFDRWYFGGEEHALSAAQRRGFELFTGKANCVTCHQIQARHALFTDQLVHNTGLGYRRSMAKAAGKRQIQVAPGTYLMIDDYLFAQAAEPVPHDLGYYEISGNPADRWKYKTPSLRNVAHSAPYMHDGSLPTLRAVVDFYNAGGIINELLDPLLRPLALVDSEAADLVAFLRSLTGANVDKLVSDAFAAPIGDP